MNGINQQQNHLRHMSYKMDYLKYAAAEVWKSSKIASLKIHLIKAIWKIDTRVVRTFVMTFRIPVAINDTNCIPAIETKQMFSTIIH